MPTRGGRETFLQTALVAHPYLHSLDLGHLIPPDRANRRPPMMEKIATMIKHAKDLMKVASGSTVALEAPPAMFEIFIVYK